MLKIKIIPALIINKIPNMPEAIVKNFSTPRLVWKPEKSPPNVADNPVPLFCNKIPNIKRMEIIICETYKNFSIIF